MPDPAEVRALLARHQPSDAIEAHHRARMVALLASQGDAFTRTHYFPGHFTASAFVVPPERDAVLLIHHEKLGRWLQPGGHLEPDDASPMAAARRELREETGLCAVEALGADLLDVDVHDIPAHGASPAHQHFDLRFAFLATTRVVSAASDALAVRWAPFDALSHSGSDASVRRAVVRLRDRVARH